MSKTKALTERQRKERSKSYGDPNYKGRGIIKCRVCNGKLRDHPMEPCSQLGERLIKVGANERGKSPDAN